MAGSDFRRRKKNNYFNGPQSKLSRSKLSHLAWVTFASADVGFWAREKKTTRMGAAAHARCSSLAVRFVGGKRLREMKLGRRGRQELVQSTEGELQLLRADGGSLYLDKGPCLHVQMYLVLVLCGTKVSLHMDGMGDGGIVLFVLLALGTISSESLQSIEWLVDVRWRNFWHWAHCC